MRILFLTSRLPYPPDRGDRLRAYHFLRALAQDHEITLVSFIARTEERSHLPALQPYCQEIVLQRLPAWRSTLNAATGLWRQEPLQALYYRHPAMARHIDRLLAGERFDMVYVHLFRMAPYVAGRGDLYRVVDLTDAISEEVARSLPYRGPLSRLLYTIERPRIARYERRVATEFEEAWLISPADRQALQADCPGANLKVVTNGVDFDRFHPADEAPEPYRLIMVGHMGVFHNVDAARFLAEEILPRVRRSVPDCSLRLVGADPSPAVRRLADLPGVTVTGFLPDLNAELNRAAVFVAPLRFAAGVQNKVLEAMAAGRPVVTTSLVAAGLGARPGEHLLVADETDGLAAHIAGLLAAPERGRALGAAAREYVQAHFSWQMVRRRAREIEGGLPEFSMQA